MKTLTKTKRDRDYKLDAEDTAAILAGLRLLQVALERNDFPDDIWEIFTNDGEFENGAMDIGFINELCETINCHHVIVKDYYSVPCRDCGAVGDEHHKTTCQWTASIGGTRP